MKSEIVASGLKKIGEYPPRTSEMDGVRRRFLLNIASNVVFIATQAVATLWLTPYLIGYLGIAAFGMIPLG